MEFATATTTNARHSNTLLESQTSFSLPFIVHKQTWKGTKKKFMLSPTDPLRSFNLFKMITAIFRQITLPLLEKKCGLLKVEHITGWFEHVIAFYYLFSIRRRLRKSERVSLVAINFKRYSNESIQLGGFFHSSHYARTENRYIIMWWASIFNLYSCLRIWPWNLCAATRANHSFEWKKKERRREGGERVLVGISYRIKFNVRNAI